MAHDDFDVIVYKVLTYIMACAKKGVAPSIEVAKKAAGCNDVYWAMVVQSMLDDGLIRGATVDSYYDGETDVSASPRFGITQTGAAFLRDNSRMQKAKDAFGAVFEAALPSLLQMTMTLGGLA